MWLELRVLLFFITWAARSRPDWWVSRLEAEATWKILRHTVVCIRGCSEDGEMFHGYVLKLHLPMIWTKQVRGREKLKMTPGFAV